MNHDKTDGCSGTKHRLLIVGPVIVTKKILSIYIKNKRLDFKKFQRYTDDVNRV